MTVDTLGLEAHHASDSCVRQIPMKVEPDHATADIIHPLTGRQVNFLSLFSTHPPTAERNARLQAGI